MELTSGRFTFHIFLFCRRDYPRDQTARRLSEDDVCDRVRLDRSVTVMADRQGQTRCSSFEAQQYNSRDELNKNAPNHNKGYG